MNMADGESMDGMKFLKNSFKVMVAGSFPTEPPSRKANKSPGYQNWVCSSSFLLLMEKHVVDTKGRRERGLGNPQTGHGPDTGAATVKRRLCLKQRNGIS